MRNDIVKPPVNRQSCVTLSSELAANQYFYRTPLHK